MARQKVRKSIERERETHTHRETDRLPVTKDTAVRMARQKVRKSIERERARHTHTERQTDCL